jgi:hypothetical protein
MLRLKIQATKIYTEPLEVSPNKGTREISNRWDLPWQVATGITL